MRFFSENILYLSDKLSLTPGLRLESIRTQADGSYNQVNFDNAGNPILNENIPETQDLKRGFFLLGLGLSYKAKPSFELTANFSQNYRSVTFSDIRIVSPTFIVDPNINDERGFTADMGIRGKKDNILSYEATIYSVFYDDRIGIVLDRSANRVRKNIGRALIGGLESFLSFNALEWLAPEKNYWSLNLFLNSSFTFSEYLASEENNVVGKKVEFIPGVNIKTGISFGYKNVELSYQGTYVGSQFTDVQNSERAALGDVRSGIIGPIPAYSVSDLHLSWIIGRFKISSGLNNLWDQSYFTRRATGYPGPGIIPSAPRGWYFGIRYLVQS